MITRILRSDMEYLQSKHIVAEQNSGQEPITEEDAMGLLSCQDTVEAAVKDDCDDNQKAESQRHHRDPAGPQETAGDDQLLHMEWEQEEGRRKVLLVIATLTASVTYQAAGFNIPAGAFCEENKQQAYHRRRCMASLFCDATAFALSLVIVMLLVNRKLMERRMQSNALSACVILDLAGFTDASAGVSSRTKVSAFVYVFTMVFAVLGCTTVHVLARTETCSLGHKGEAGTLQDHHGMIGASATGSRCSAREAIWRVASGAAHHMTGNQSLLLTGGGYLPLHHGGEGVVVRQHAKGGEVPLRARGSGSVRTERIALDDVWYVPGLDSNLVSTGQLARQGCDVTLGPGGCRITRAGALVGSARFTEACHFQLDFLKLAGSE